MPERHLRADDGVRIDRELAGGAAIHRVMWPNVPVPRLDVAEECWLESTFHHWGRSLTRIGIASQIPCRCSSSACGRPKPSSAVVSIRATATMGRKPNPTT